MKVGIMQPYIFPYIGYFQLIQTVDTFVFYDDVNYIKGGWINRNKILVNGKENLFTVPLINSSSFKLIQEIDINHKSKDFTKILKTLEQTYVKAPHFNNVYPVLKNLFENHSHQGISTFAIQSVKHILDYLNIEKKVLISSEHFNTSQGLEKTDRIIHICKDLGAKTYINAIGGQALYSKEYFIKQGIKLNFIQSKPITYKQHTNEFVPWLSIIDVLMFNSIEEVNNLLNRFELT